MSKELYSQSALHRMVRYDARREILESIGDLSGITVFKSWALVAPYVQSGLLWSPTMGFPLEERLSLKHLYDLYESTKGFKNPLLARESIYQGKVLLILKVGKDHPQEVAAGRWIWTLQENTSGVSISAPGAKKSRVLEFVQADYTQGWPCKLMDMEHIMGHLDEPEVLA